MINDYVKFFNNYKSQGRNPGFYGPETLLPREFRNYFPNNPNILYL